LSGAGQTNPLGHRPPLHRWHEIAATIKTRSLSRMITDQRILDGIAKAIQEARAQKAELKSRARAIGLTPAAADPAMTTNRRHEPPFRLVEPSAKALLGEPRAAFPWLVAVGSPPAHCGRLLACLGGVSVANAPKNAPRSNDGPEADIGSISASHASIIE
jgi:hypothetical protein